MLCMKLWGCVTFYRNENNFGVGNYIKQTAFLDSVKTPMSVYFGIKWNFEKKRHHNARNNPVQFEWLVKADFNMCLCDEFVIVEPRVFLFSVLITQKIYTYQGRTQHKFLYFLVRFRETNEEELSGFYIFFSFLLPLSGRVVRFHWYPHVIIT